MILVLVDINMNLEARNTNFKALNLPMPKEKEIKEVEEIDRRARRQGLPTVRRLQIYGDLEAGGTSKTYLLKTLLDAVRSNWGHGGEEDYYEPSIGLATASTGISATLLKLEKHFIQQ
jgi:hypothetical protein